MIVLSEEVKNYLYLRHNVPLISEYSSLVCQNDLCNFNLFYIYKLYILKLGKKKELAIFHKFTFKLFIYFFTYSMEMQNFRKA
jgi:hypothetical protein